MYEVDEVSCVGRYVRRIAEVLNRELKRESRLFNPSANTTHRNTLHSQPPQISLEPYRTQ